MKIQEILNLLDQILGAPLEEILNFDLDFSPESLVDVEEAINGMYPAEGAAQFSEIIPFGLYLGEVIVRNIRDAKWTEDELKHLAHAYITCPVVAKKEHTKAKVYPFLRVSKFFKDRTDGLVLFFDYINVTSLGFLDPTDSQNGVWQEKGGFRFRTRHTDKEDSEK